MDSKRVYGRQTAVLLFCFICEWSAVCLRASCQLQRPAAAAAASEGPWRGCLSDWQDAPAAEPSPAESAAVTTTSGQSNSTSSPHRRRTRTVQSHSPGGGNVHCTPCLLQRTQIHNPNGISIGSADFCTAHGRKSLYFTMGCPFPSVSPLYGGSGLHLMHAFWAYQSPEPKQHLDFFIRFCRAHDCDTQTDHATGCSNRPHRLISSTVMWPNNYKALIWGHDDQLATF